MYICKFICNFLFDFRCFIYSCFKRIYLLQKHLDRVIYLVLLGMIIAITVTFLSIGNFSSGFIFVLMFISIGGVIGAFIAYKIPMTAMPELVAGFHSLVGLAAVFVAISAFLNPSAFNLGTVGNIKLASLIEMSIKAAVGAITFSGSVIAFLKNYKELCLDHQLHLKANIFKCDYINFNSCINLFIVLNSIIKFILDTFSCFILIGFLLIIIPIGGADMM